MKSRLESKKKNCDQCPKDSKKEYILMKDKLKINQYIIQQHSENRSFRIIKEFK